MLVLQTAGWLEWMRMLVRAMIATPYSTEGCENQSGHYSSIAKSLYRAAIDSGYPIIVMSQNWCLVGAGSIRFLISK